jgi:phosphoglycolate phosphatase
MTAFPFDIVAFDLDGTLADTAPDIGASLNHTLAALGRPELAPETVRALIGEGARTLLRKALERSGAADADLVEHAYPIYLDHYAAHICVGTRTYPGVEAAMDELAARNARLAICTNKPERLTLQLLDALGWSTRFSAIVGADTLPYRKPDPRTLAEAVARAGGGRAAYVGDSITDVETARAAGLPSIVVSFGFRDRPAGELGADAMIESFDMLVPTLERL